jgi:peptidoglycan hydrolase CwlO-like protein
MQGSNMKIILNPLWIALIIALSAPLQLSAQSDMSIEEKEAHLEDLRYEIDRLSDENSSLNTQLDDYESRINELKQRIEELDAQIADNQTN